MVCEDLVSSSNRHPADCVNSEVVVKSNPISLFVLRLLESSMLNAEVREGEILPPTIQRLMKGYNKYLRPFFDSKETADTCSNGNDNALRGNGFDSEQEGLILQFRACMLFLSNIR